MALPLLGGKGSGRAATTLPPSLSWLAGGKGSREVAVSLPTIPQWADRKGGCLAATSLSPFHTLCAPQLAGGQEDTWQIQEGALPRVPLGRYGTVVYTDYWCPSILAV